MIWCLICLMVDGDGIVRQNMQSSANVGADKMNESEKKEPKTKKIV